MKTTLLGEPGITAFFPLEGSREWYWGMDYTSGDLYEAEELYRDGHRIQSNRLVLLNSETGRVFCPLRAQKGQYFGSPVFSEGRIILLLADFQAGWVRILHADESQPEVRCLAELPLSRIENCYNLLLHVRPLILTRQSADHRFQILWPDHVDFPIGTTESFECLDGDLIYFSRWFEDPDYREEIVVRSRTGEIVRTSAGRILWLPDGRKWLIT